MSIPTITANELKQLQDSEQPILLVMTMDQAAYNRLHITESLVFPTLEDALIQVEAQSDDSLIVLYCSTSECSASYQAYHRLHDMEIHNVKVLEGGLQAWLEMGYSVSGSEKDRA